MCLSMFEDESLHHAIHINDLYIEIVEHNLFNFTYLLNFFRNRQLHPLNLIS